MGNLHKKLLSFFLLLFISMPFYVSAYPEGAGTCDVDKISTGHGTSNLKGSASYTMNATMLSPGSFEFTVGGPGGGVKGMLVYVVGPDNKRVGEFVKLPDNMQIKNDCDTKPTTITHKDPSLKNFPFKIYWQSPQGTSGGLTIKSVVVKDFKDWAKLDDVNFDPTTGVSNTVAGGASNDTTESTGSDGFLQKYSLFIIMIGITTLLYIVGSVTEAMLKRQQVKSRSFAKTIQNGFGDSR